MLLLEGGAAGHIMHLYEDYDLTFNKLKDIIEKLALNKIQCTEKTDGLNLYFSYKNRKVKAVRNKTEFKLGGLDFEHFDMKDFQGGENIKQVFNEAFISFERSVSKLSNTEVKEIFGDAEDIFLNCEIISGKTNVIPYEKSLILVHRSGHKQFIEETGTLKVLPEEENVRITKIVEVLLPSLNQEQNKFQIVITPFKQLTEIFDMSQIETILEELTKYGFNSEIKIKQFLHSRITKQVNEILNNKFVSEQLANKMLDLPTSEIILSDLDIKNREEFKKCINDILSNKKDYKKQAIIPLENAVHKIGVLLLSNQKSNFIEDQNQAISKIKQEVENSINKIRSSQVDDKKVKKISKEIEKIGNIENINSTIEGIVFQVNDKVYKLTGNFAPINQIVNLTESKQLQRRTIVIYPGRFQPFHKGHLAAYRYLIDKFGQENVNIFTSDVVNDNSPLNFEERKRLMNFAGVPNEYIWYAAEPYKAEEVINNIKGIDPNQTTLVYAISMKDMIEDPRFSFKPNPDGSPSYMQPYKDSFEPMNKHCYVLTYPKVDFKVLDKEFDSSAQIREYYPTLDKEQQRLFIRDLYGKYSKDIQKIMNKKTPSSISINEILNIINEMSGVGVGGNSSVEGAQNIDFSKNSKSEVENENIESIPSNKLLSIINKRLKDLENNE